MRTDDASNQSTTATTSKSAPSSPETKSKGLSESHYLDKQAKDAKQAVSKVIAEMKQTIADGLNLGEWAGRYPWLTLGGAAVAGFAAAAGLVPSKEDQALKRLTKLEKALHPAPPAAAENGHPKSPKPGGGLLGGLAHELLRAAQPVLMSLVTAGATAHAAKPPQEEIHVANAPPPSQGEEEISI